MVVKAFNVSEETYDRFSKICKESGLSMSKQVDIFMKSQIEEQPKVRKSYLEKLEAIRKGTFVHVKGTLAERYNV